jgi:hypothetical protein
VARNKRKITLLTVIGAVAGTVAYYGIWVAYGETMVRREERTAAVYREVTEANQALEACRHASLRSDRSDCSIEEQAAARADARRREVDGAPAR